jgi:hypothetical protein
MGIKESKLQKTECNQQTDVTEKLWLIKSDQFSGVAIL